MTTSSKDVKKINDHFHRTSATSLKREMKLQITKVYVAALETIECKWGTDFPGYQEIRAKILRCGNNALRYMETLLDKKYNVQKIPDITFLMKEKGTHKKGEKNNG